MKFKFLLLTLLFVSTSGFSQTWAPDGAKWHYTLNFLSATYYSYNSYTVQGDTVINGTTCSRLRRHTYSCNYRPDTEYMYRDSNKVYFWNSGDSSFSLLYDFGAQTGDSYKIAPVETIFPTPPYDTITVTVDSVYTLNINGQNRQVQVVHQSRAAWPNIVTNHSIIEGIGSTWQMFTWDNIICDSQWDRELRCYEDTLLGAYNTEVADSCDEEFFGTTAMDQGIQSHFTVYPKPASEFVSWKGVENGYVKARLIDIKGQVIREVETAERKIDVRELENGLYFIEVEEESGRVSRDKFLLMTGN